MSSVGDEGAVQWSDGTGGFLGDALQLKWTYGDTAYEGLHVHTEPGELGGSILNFYYDSLSDSIPIFLFVVSSPALNNTLECSRNSDNGKGWVIDDGGFQPTPLTPFNLPSIYTEVLVDTNGYLITDNTNGIIFVGDDVGSAEVQMPANPYDGRIITISTTGAIASLSHIPNTGQTLVGALTSMAANQGAAWIYKLADTTWYPFIVGNGISEAEVMKRISIGW